MFTTYPPFKFPVQIDPDITDWTAVELGLDVPWLLVTFMDRKEPVKRTFLVAGSINIGGFVVNNSLGDLLALRLVLPPHRSFTGDWAFVPISRVGRLRDTDSEWKTVLTAATGTQYRGFPIAPVQVDEKLLEALITLEG